MEQIIRSFAKEYGFGRPDEVQRDGRVIACRFGDNWQAVAASAADDVDAVENSLRSW